MRPLTIRDPDIILGLQDEIRRSEESRYEHRLHGLLLVAQGMSCREVAQLLGDSARAVQYWVNRFERDGLAAMVEGERQAVPVLWEKRNWQRSIEFCARLRKRPAWGRISGMARAYRHSLRSNSAWS